MNISGEKIKKVFSFSQMYYLHHKVLVKDMIRETLKGVRALIFVFEYFSPSF
jgi:hypothetical protein